MKILRGALPNGAAHPFGRVPAPLAKAAAQQRKVVDTSGRQKTPKSLPPLIPKETLSATHT